MQGQRQRSRRRSKRQPPSPKLQQHIDTALPVTRPGYYNYYDEDDDEPFGGGLKLEDLRLTGSPTATINMVYQYVFDEGLELSLVPENEAAPFTSGPKVLELGLSGFTGRLIITQQSFRQYGLNSYVLHGEEKKDTSVVSSSSSESEGRQPLYQSASKSRPANRQQRGAEQVQDTAKRRGKDAPATTSKRKTGKAGSSPRSKKGGQQSPPPDAIDALAAVFVSSEVSNQMNLHVGQIGVDSLSNSVEVVSVASSVSTRAPVRAGNEDTMDKFASMFATQATVREDKVGDIDEGSMARSSQGGSVANDHRLSGSQGSMGSGEAPTTAGDALDEFASAFVALSGPSSGQVADDGGGSIDDETSLAAASRAESDAAEDHLSDFAAAFTALSRKPETEGDSIDDDKTSSNASAAASQRSASSSSRTIEEQGADDAISDFVSTFTALSGAPNVPEVTLCSIDESASESASASAMSASYSHDSGRVFQTKKQPQQEKPMDALSDFSEPPDPITDFVNAFGALTAPAVRGPSKEQTIDEDSASSAPSASTTTAPQSSASLSSSEDPLTQFTKAYSPDEPGGPRSIQAPQAPSGKASPDQSQRAQSKPSETKMKKKRVSQKSKARRASGAAGGKPKISLEKKRKIREMFPNYPDVSTGSHGSLDPVGVYLHQKCSSPFEKTLTPTDLRELLEVFPFAAYCADDKGRLPLHVLGENGWMVRDPQGRQRATALARLLIQAYPQSVTYPDSEGRLPFVALLHQWIEAHYEQYNKDQPKPSSKKSLATLQGKPGLLGQEERPIQYDELFPNIELWPFAEWCFSMLSMVLDDMVGKGILEEAIANRPIHEQMEARRQYVGNVLQSLPYLMKSVLFLDGGSGSARMRILQTSFLRRALLSRDSVGKWLEAMVLKEGVPLKLAVDYFQLLSETIPADYVGPKRAPSEQDVEDFRRERKIVYREIEKMGIVIPPLAVLDEGGETEI